MITNPKRFSQNTHPASHTFGFGEEGVGGGGQSHTPKNAKKENVPFTKKAKTFLLPKNTKKRFLTLTLSLIPIDRPKKALKETFLLPKKKKQKETFLLPKKQKKRCSFLPQKCKKHVPFTKRSKKRRSFYQKMQRKVFLRPKIVKKMFLSAKKAKRDVPFTKKKQKRCSFH